jgi:hypothetical protein
MSHKLQAAFDYDDSLRSTDMTRQCVEVRTCNPGVFDFFQRVLEVRVPPGWVVLGGRVF